MSDGFTPARLPQLVCVPLEPSRGREALRGAKASNNSVIRVRLYSHERIYPTPCAATGSIYQALFSSRASRKFFALFAVKVFRHSLHTNQKLLTAKAAKRRRKARKVFNQLKP